MSKALTNKIKLNNISDTGTSTFAAATTVAVTLPVEEPDTNYFVLFENPANQILWVTSKTTTGFTVNSSVSNSTTVGWFVLRNN